MVDEEKLQRLGIMTDIVERWEKGIPHHPEAEQLAHDIGELDWLYGDDGFCLKFGGDGDNGETLTYLLDIYFELQDALTNSKL